MSRRARIGLPQVPLWGRILFVLVPLFIATFAGVALVQLFGLTVLGVEGDLSAEKRELRRHLSLAAELVEGRVEEWFLERTRDSLVLAEGEGFREGIAALLSAMPAPGAATEDWRALRDVPPHDRLRRQLIRVRDAYRVYVRVRVIHVPTGRVLVSTGEETGERTPHAELVTRLANRDTWPSVSLVESSDRDDPLICIHRKILPMPDRGSGPALLSMSIPSGNLPIRMIEGRHDLGETGEVVLVDRHRRLLAPLRHHPDLSLLDTTIDSEAVSRAAAGARGAIAAEDHRGVQVFAAYRSIFVTDEFRLGLVLQQDQEEIFAPLYAGLYRDLAVVLTGLLVLVVVSLLVSRRVLKPVGELGSAAAAVAGGDLSARVPVRRSVPEFAVLAESFNDMASRVETGHQELEDRVETRTRELARSERRYRALFEQVTDAVYVTDERFIVVAANPAAFELSGYGPEDLGRLRIADLYEDSAVAERDVRDVLARGSLRDYLVRLKRRDGTVLLCRVSSSVRTSEDGRPEGIVGSARDVTEEVKHREAVERHAHQQTELAKFAQESLRFRSLDEIGAAALDLLTETLGADACALLLRRDDGELTVQRALGYRSIRTGDLVAGGKVESQSGLTLALGEPVVTPDLRREDRFGHHPEIEALGLRSSASAPVPYGHPFRGVIIAHSKEPDRFSPASGSFLASVAAMVGAMMQRNDAEEERARLAKALEQTADAVVVADREGRIYYMNAAAESTTGWSAGDPAVPSLSDLLPGAQAGLEEMLRGTTPFTGRLTARRSGDGEWVAEASVSPIRDEKGEVVSVVAVLRDVSAESELQAQLRQAQKLEAVGRLAGGVAHDFNNALTVIGGYVDLLLGRGTLGERDAKYLTEIRSSVRRASDLTQQLLAFSRRKVVEPRRVSPRDVLANAEGLVRRLVGEDVQLDVRLEPASTILADPVQLEQVLMNLVVNARDAMPKGGRLHLGCRDVEFRPEDDLPEPEMFPGVWAEITVRDDGEGMDKETVSRIFEPFFTTKEVGKGTGLGLSTVYGIVAQLGGRVTVNSEPGRGSEFRIFLPAVAGPPEASLPVEAGLATPRDGGEDATILVVEDEPALRDYLREVLKESAFQVHVVYDGAAALDWLDRTGEVPALLVTDVVMPGLSGPELAGAVRERHPELPVLFMSGYTGGEMTRHGLDIEAGSLLEKPFRPDEFIDAIHRALKRSRE